MSEEKNNQILHAQIDWSDQSEPFSPLFDDLYFNSEQGLEESRYVFVEGNQLIETWSTWQEESFSIAETGFGTGLNFLLTCYIFDQFVKNNSDKQLKKLFFTSFEKYPLKEQDLQKSLQKWPVISEFVTQLISQYPLAISGCHHLHFESITLDLWFGDVHDSLPLLYENQNSLFDCWYLDGFAPNKNPDMWNENLFSLIAQNSKFGATIATFTAAGFVRRGLQASGFKMSKRKGYGKKREMLVGELQNIATNNQHGSKR